MSFRESHICEDYIIRQLEERGWRFVPSQELEREAVEEPLLVPNLIRAVERINASLGIGDEEINRVVNELKLTGTGVEGAKRILQFYRFGIPVKLEKEKIVERIRLFDESNIENNEFIVTRQVHYSGKDRIRTDIILYVNGIPLVNIECKDPTKPTENWQRAYRQIKDYEQTVPELYKYVQIGVAAESIARYFPIVPWDEEVRTHQWHEEGKDPIDSTIEMLSPERLLDIITHFLLVRIEHGRATKVIARYMQYRAANKIIERVLRRLKGEDSKNRGLIWHWQGSGKTLTMIFTACKLFYMRELENPSIFFTVDRAELEEQLYTEFGALDTVKPEVIGSVQELKDVLSYEDYRGKRGLFITLIHKFRPEEMRQLQKELEEVSRVKETIMNRKNIVAFIDEGHRTQYGLLASQMRTLFKEAFFFAFTGTPIGKKDRNTYREFSYPPEEPYLDRYFITDSLRDGFTVKIVYQPRLEKEWHLKKDMLEAFWSTQLEEIPEDLRDVVDEELRKRLNYITMFLEDEERIKIIAEDIATHFKENVDGRFKAMVVAASRTACEYYRAELSKHLPSDYIRVVMTYGQETKPILQNAVAEIRAEYGQKSIEEIRKEIIERFKEENELPKILIVTDMLLTGFDAPILGVMYLDKPLKEHRLLQAVARTNRPFRDLKEAGLIIDYVGVLKEFKKALEMYSEDDLKGALFSYENLREEFVSLINETLEIFKDVPMDYERESLLKAIEIITTDSNLEKKFVDSYKALRKTFELLGPDEIKIEHLEAYRWLSGIYTYYMKVVNQSPALEDEIERFYEKTIRFIHKTTEIEEIRRDLPAIVFDRDYLEALESKVKNKKEKAANILFTLNKLVLVERHRNPVYESLVDKVERLLEMWRQKNKDYERIYLEGAKIVKNINALFKRKESLGFEDYEYAMLLTLEDKLGRKDELTSMVREFSSRLKSYIFPNWHTQPTVRKEIERQIRRFVRGIKARYSLSFEDMDELHRALMEGVEKFAIL
jgi:type I restriction enzyme R subunit